MTDFNWLDASRLVQRAVFDDRVELVANFSQEPYAYQDASIAPRSLFVRWKDSERRATFTSKSAQ